MRDGRPGCPPVTGQRCWRELPSLGVPREGLVVALARDPVSPGTHYLLALGGRNALGSLGTWEELTIGVDANGRQMPAASWAPGATTFAPRDGHAGFTIDALTLPALAGATRVLLGPGAAGSTVDGAELAVGGALGEWTSAAAWPDGLGAVGAAALGGYAYTFGGDRGGPVADVFAAPASAASPPVLGGFTLVPGPLSLARSLPGVAAAGPVVFVAGGASAAGPTARVESRAW